jgi:hypothetical protein
MLRNAVAARAAIIIIKTKLINDMKNAAHGYRDP